VTRGAVEIELKFDAPDPDGVTAWLDQRYPADDGGWAESRLADRYFDTSDFSIARAGYGARVRRRAGQLTVEIKTDGTVDGARHQRTEIMGPATIGLEPARWPASEARDLLERLAGGRPLVERFTIRQRRRERRLQLDGAEALASLDDARVIVGGRTIGRLRGLEVELLSGKRKALRRLATELEASGLVEAQPLSKVQLGHFLAAAQAPISHDDLFAEAGRKVLARHLLRLLDREPLVRAGDPLALKQMRVATRRLRSTWRLFEGAYRRSEQRRHVAGLRLLGRRLGEVRDLDVLLAGLPDDPDLAALAEAWRVERAMAMEALLRHLDSRAHREWAGDHAAFVASPGRATARRLEASLVGEHASTRVNTAITGLLSSVSSIANADEPTLHALRVQAKRTRYGIEAFRDVLATAPAERLRLRLVGLQDSLGALNDAAIAGARAEAWAASIDPAPAPATQRAVERLVFAQRGRIAALRRQAERTWRGLVSATAGRDIERILQSR